MKNKLGVVILTVVITLLCIYYLSFVFVSKGVVQDANMYAADSTGNIDYSKKQSYLDSVWNEPVFNLLGIAYTYKEIKETELNLGLDLQGGMHVTLEVSPVEIVKGLSGNNTDSIFLNAIEDANSAVRQNQSNFVDEFYTAFKENAPNQKLSYYFATTGNRGRISLNSTDEEVLDVIRTEVDYAIDRAFNILRTRIDRFGTSQPNIQRLQGTGRIQIELPGVDNPQRVRNLLQGVAKLEFWQVYEINEIADILQNINSFLVEEEKLNEQLELEEGAADNLESLSEDVEPLAKDTLKERDEGLESLLTENSDEPDETIVRADSVQDTTGSDLASQLEDESDLDSAFQTVSPLFSLLRSQRALIYELKDTAKINRILNRKEVRNLIPSNLKFLWAVKPNESGSAVDDTKYIELYPIQVSRGGKAPLTGEVISDARQDYDQSSAPAISMKMNARGARIWRNLTADNINRRIAIVLDGYVYSAPVVQGEIPNGSSSITGNFTIEEAQDLANILKAGTLPAPTTIVEDVVIGPSLGKQAQAQGIISILAGLGIVIIFMAAYYSGGGLVAILALFFNVFFILGILAQLSASLTLPGIAGIVLTIGMSIDANVLIFERIKEELRNGASLKVAINSGYKKAYWSIFDANATTLLAALILYNFGQGPVKGFAITLIIGIICSFFSAVFITRVVVEWVTKNGDKEKISFTTPFSKNLLTSLNFDFLSKKKLAYTFSAIFIGLGIVAMVVKGLTLGVDFKGGRSYVINFTDPVAPSKLESSLKKSFDQSGVEVKTFGANNILKITTSYLINDPSDEADLEVRGQLIAGIEQSLGLSFTANDDNLGQNNFSIASSTKVGATIADDIKNSSYLSGSLALLAIFIYILARFRKWQFSTGAVVALFHDTLFVLSAFAIANLLGISFEIDQVFVAAILTIIGYSINDTVVVFDRIRENLGIKAGSDIVKVINESLNLTLSRTLITSATTLIVIIILFIFGGPSLKGFSFAFLVGILIGTYSSVFIATPVVVDLETSKSSLKKKAVA
ncbi:MAG TPA: protein translocase subunit SecDF [Cyclobacteriaceae bacterium]